MKRIISVMLALVLLALPIANAVSLEAQWEDPVGKDLAAVHAPLLTAGGIPSQTEFFTIDDVASHSLTIINVWSDGCAPCVSEMPVFERAYHELAERDVLVVGCCSTWLGGSFSAEWDVIQSNGYTYPNYIQDTVLYDLYSGNGVLPQTFIVSGDGLVLEFIDGTISYKRLTDKVDYWFGVMADAHYDVDFVDGVTGEIFETQSVAIGGRPVYPEPPEHEGWRFVGWLPGDPPVVLGPTTVLASYIPRNWHVRFYDGLTGQRISAQFVQHGAAAVPPEPPEHEGYAFAGWDVPFDCVVSDLDVSALYISTEALGDVDLSGDITSADALMALRFALGLSEPTQEQAVLADIDRSGTIDTADALLILRLALGI